MVQKKYAVWCLIGISVLTVQLVSGFGLTETNFSVIGNQEGRRGLLLCWGALVGNYYYLYMENLMEQAKCTDLWMRIFLPASLFLLTAGVGLPYLPRLVPKLSGFHVFLSFSATLCMALSQARFLWLLQKKTGKIWKKQWCMQVILGLCSVALLLKLEMVSSLLEIFLTAGVCLYLWLLQQKLENFRDSL